MKNTKILKKNIDSVLIIITYNINNYNIKKGVI